MEKILSISLKLNFTQNTLGFYGLRVLYSQKVDTFVKNDHAR